MANHVARIAYVSLADAFVALCERRGRSPDDVWHGMSDLRSRAWIDWSEWVELNARVEAALEGPDDLPMLVEIWGERAPSLGPFRKVLSRFVSPEQVVRGVWIWSGPNMFRPPVPRVDFAGGRLARLTLALPDGFADCQFFFAFSALAAARLPTLIGLPPAEVVEKAVTGRALSLVLRLPPSKTAWALFADRWRRARDDGLLADALIDAQRHHNAERSLLSSLLVRSRDGVLVVRGDEVVELNEAASMLLGIVAGPLRSPEIHRLLRVTEGEEALQRLYAGTPRERWVRAWRTAAAGGAGEVLFVRDVTDSEVVRREMERMQRYASLGETGAVLGHEIATIMTAVRGELQWCLEQGARHPDTVPASLTRALDGATHAARVARNLLVPASRRESVEAEHDLGLLLRTALDIVSWAARDGQVELATDGEGDGIAVRCAGTDVILVLVNLLKNAVEAAAPSVARLVRLKVERGAPTVVVVEDSGDGLPLGLDGRWGELTADASGSASGHGIGLVVARQLAVRNGAELSYERSSGWTRFRLRLRPA